MKSTNTVIVTYVEGENWFCDTWENAAAMQVQSRLEVTHEKGRATYQPDVWKKVEVQNAGS